jgi:predicted transcriptional regulator
LTVLFDGKGLRPNGKMTQTQQLLTFIKDNFRSVWALELLILLAGDSERAISHDELVARLRASDSVVGQSLSSLVAAGIVSTEEDGGARFAPASADIERLAKAAVALYAQKPDAVRRLIVLGQNGSLAAFADAFRLRKD